MYARARWLLIALSIVSAIATAAENTELQEAQKLAWNRHFVEAEQIYRRLLRASPRSRDVRIGLADVLLWTGRYREARAMFLQLASERTDVEAEEGAATAAYWQGDFRTAAREFRAIITAHPGRSAAAQSLRDIELSTRPAERLAIEVIDDDQPYRLLRSTAQMSLFSDPLTRWDVAAGFYHAANPTFGVTHTEPFATIVAERVFPWQSLTVTATAGALRWPDGVTRPTGGIALRLRASSASAVWAAADHRELLRTATAINSHPAVTRLALGWTRYTDHGWLGGAEAGDLRYFDRNRGWFVQGYALWPLLHRNSFTLWGGASGALRDTRDSRFYIEAVSSELSGSAFDYSYRGAYTPYWTPQRLREGRLLVSAKRTVARNTTIKAQIEAGVARDRAESFGPAAGPAPFPPSIFTFQFWRTYRPIRFSIAASVKLRSAYSLELSAARETTVFYRANEYDITLVRHR